MSFVSAPLVRCAVHLTHSRLSPGDAVEGAITIDAATAFPVGNVHVKIVGKESVHAFVDQVKESKTANLQYGVTSQDYVYYREVVTLAGPLITQKTGAPQRDPDNNNDNSNSSNAINDGTFPVTRNSEDAEEVLQYNESVCVPPGVAVQSRSCATSQLAAEEGVCVTFPAGHFVYPFRFLLPTTLPPSYNTGMCVKEGQHSNSQAMLGYYVKVYVWSPARVELASARADFVVGAVLPKDSSSSLQESGDKKREARDTQGDAGNTTLPPRVSDDRLHVRQPSTSTAGRTVHCTFPITGACSCIATGGKLKVAFVMAMDTYAIGEDIIAGTCVVATNTSPKSLHGLRVELVQTLRFDTAEGCVTVRRTLLKGESAKTAVIPTGKGGTMTAHTSVLDASSPDLLPSMQTAGLGVRYSIRVELVDPHIDHPCYEFEDVQLRCAGSQDVSLLPGVQPPPPHFSALPRGRLTRREAYYVVPVQPCEAPVIAALAAPLSRQGSRTASRRASRLNTLAADPSVGN